MADYLSLNDGVIFINKEEQSIHSLEEHTVRQFVFDRNHLPGNVDRKVKVEKETPFIQLKIIEKKNEWRVKSSLWRSEERRVGKECRGRWQPGNGENNAAEV